MRDATLGLCIIAKDEESNIGSLLMSVKDAIDVVYLTDTGSTDGTISKAKKVCKRLNIPLEVSRFEWIDHFAKARNYNFSRAKTDYIIWLDCDDVLEEADLLKPLVNNMSSRGIDAMILPYRYKVDERGNDIVVHSKLRIVKNGKYEWDERALVHENLMGDGSIASFKNITVRHKKSKVQEEKSSDRNLKILLKSDQDDPRVMFYLGKEYVARDDMEKAEQYLVKYLGVSGWDSEMMSACEHLCMIYERKSDFNKQLDYAFKALQYYPESPMGYLMVAKAYQNLGEHEKVIIFIEQSMDRDTGILDGIVHTPYWVDKLRTDIGFRSYIALEDYEKGLDLIDAFLDRASTEDADALKRDKRLGMIERMKGKQLDSFVVMANTLEKEKEYKMIQSLIDMMPTYLQYSDPVLQLKRNVGLHKIWNKGSIVLFCGKTNEEWSEHSLKTGIGGSETAVAEMAKRWGAMGYKVTVYNSIEDKKVFGNVTYLPFTDVDFADEYDIFISWRSATLFEKVNIKAKKSYVWLHDVPNAFDFSKKVLSRVDKVVVLSEFHRNYLPSVPDEKIYISRNGIDVDLIKEVEKEGVKRNPKKIIYCSLPERGLEEVIKIFEKVKEKEPDAECVWAYGWVTYDAYRTTPEDVAWKAHMIEEMKRVGIKDLGRLPKKDLLKEMANSGIWLYPCTFPEISCIVAMEAQASGCYPITNGYAALAETQKFGIQDDIEKLTDRVLSSIKVSKDIYKDVKNVREFYSWDGVAKEWAIDLFHGVEFEEEMPLVTMMMITKRKGDVLEMFEEAVNKQTYPNLNAVIIDAYYDERSDYFDGKDNFLHLPDPERNKKKYKFGINHALNAGIYASNGELIVLIQDYIDVPEDGVERFVSHYRNDKTKLYTATGRILDNGIEVYRSLWEKIGKGRYVSNNPRTWEINWAAASKETLLKYGGFDNEWDTGFGWDNVVFALKFVLDGGRILVDENNQCTAKKHTLINEDKKLQNTKRFKKHYQYMLNNKHVNLRPSFNRPKYSEEVKERIRQSHNR